MMISCLAFSSTLNMETKCSSETSVDFQRTTQRHVPEDRILSLPSLLKKKLNFKVIYERYVCLERLQLLRENHYRENTHSNVNWMALYMHVKPEAVLGVVAGVSQVLRSKQVWLQLEQLAGLCIWNG
jgi:hypothetical protein